MDKSLNTAICCIAKCENHYLQEWADYHLALGFKHIYIYDNNDEDGEAIEPLFNANERVTVMSVRGKGKYQRQAYIDFYRRFGGLYDWIAYIDVDEFITLNENSGFHSIDDFLLSFDGKGVDVIHLNWMLFGDNNLVCTDSFSVLDRFVEPLPFDIKLWGNEYPENEIVKSIYRGGLFDRDKKDDLVLNWGIDPHTCHGQPEWVFVDARGEKCDENWRKPYDFSVAYVRHFFTKTIVEWIIKKSRGRGDGEATQWPGKYSFDSFFDINTRTKEKEMIVRSYNFFRETLSNTGFVEEDFIANYNKEWVRINKELGLVEQRYQRVLNSKAYRLGKFILRPFSWIRSVIGI